MRSGILAFLLLSLSSGIGTAVAQEASSEDNVIGRVKTVSGDANIITGNETHPADLGSAVFQGDILETGVDGSLGVVFSDESRISLGPDTSLTVDEYVFEPKQNEGSFLSRMTRGSLLYVSGLIAKIKPESAAVETPVGTIGIRGTRFLVKVAKEVE